MITMTNREDEISVLELAQNGDKYAEHLLIEHLCKKYRSRIGRLLYRNRKLENEDIIQEFAIGIGLAIQKARLDVGDPIEYILQQGVYKARSYTRLNIIKATVQQCNECGYMTRLNKVGEQYICKKCGSSNVITTELNDNNEITLLNSVDNSIPFEEDLYGIMIIEEFEATLVKGTNVYQLYMLLRDGINRDNPEVDNYIKEIARMWGGCSQQNVTQILTKLRDRITKFAESRGLRIVNGQFLEVE